jgi:hypothetical protein
MVVVIQIYTSIKFHRTYIHTHEELSFTSIIILKIKKYFKVIQTH